MPAELSVGLWLYAITIIVMIIFAVVSNILVIYCVITFRELRSVTHTLICNLAVSDTILAGFVMPQRVHDLFHDTDYFEGEVLCKVVNCVPILAITCSSYTLVCVSFDRYLAVCRCHSPQITLQKLSKIIPLIWIFSLIICLPTLIQYQVNSVGSKAPVAGTNDTGNETAVDDSQLSCDSQHMPPEYKITNAAVLLAVSYLIPVVLMIRNYTKVAVFFWSRSKSPAAKGSERNPAPSRTVQIANRLANRLVTLLVLVAAIFTVTWLPFFVLLMYATISNQDTSVDAAGTTNLLVLALATFSTTYNIFLYVVFNPALRRAIMQVLHVHVRCGGSDSGPADQGDSSTALGARGDRKKSVMTEDSGICTIKPGPVSEPPMATSTSDITVDLHDDHHPNKSPRLSPRDPIEKF